jgi:aldehyde dehydrogenase (NAD+)
MAAARLANWIDGHEAEPRTGQWFEKRSPADGRLLASVARSGAEDVAAAVSAARRAFAAWSARTVVARADMLREAALLLRARRSEIADIVAAETGKAPKEALGETLGAVEMGFFIAGEGRRFFGRTTTSATPNKYALTMRQPLGVAGLIVPANTPIANAAWKAFPALLCGNAAVLKSAEDTPHTAQAFARILAEAGVPAGVFNVVHGFGEEAGAPLVLSPEVDVLSFTGSCRAGRWIGKVAGERLAKVCLELGGKNPLIVCEDADLPKAVEAAALSAFSNAGQRCASGSRLLVFDAVYERFRDALVERARALRVGPTDDCDFGPVINQRQLDNMLAAVAQARARGARVLCGGHRLSEGGLERGFYMAPTLLENVSPEDPLSGEELFGPISCLYRVAGFDEALSLANRSRFGLTASIHTRSTHRAMAFLNAIRSGVAVVNGPTYGSEPHMPFGGLRDSGNGTREAGPEALDVYSEWKTVYVNYDPAAV